MRVTGQIDERLACHRVSAQDFFTQILVPLIRQTAPDIRIEQVVPGGHTKEARVVGSLTMRGHPYQFIDAVTMDYLADPTLALVKGCPQPWYSFVFLGELMATSQELPTLEPVAERIFSTFSPTPRWGFEVKESVFQGMETRRGMIDQTIYRITKMEAEQTMREIHSMRETGQKWIDVLGGVSRYKDPKDPSYEGTIPWSEIPSRATRWWRCGNRAPIPSDTWPGTSCTEVPAPH
jgi:hypothetical protein